MRTLFHLTISLLLLAIFSCQDSRQTSELEVSDPTSNSSRLILNGVWIPDKYIKAIKKTMSPIEASAVLKGLSELTIDTTQIAGDSMFVGAGWNNHEGDGFYMWFKPGQETASYRTNRRDYDNQSNFYELGYEINRADTSLILYHYSLDKKLLDKSNFSKVSGASAELSEGFQYFVNSVLITGKYKLQGSGQTVEFTNSGQVSGLDNFNKYFIQTDFVVTADNNIDNVIFDVYTESSKTFAFKIKADTLEFYTTTTDTTSMELSINKLKYRLVKQK